MQCTVTGGIVWWVVPEARACARRSMAEPDGELVVNVAHLMAYVDEQREEGNAAFKQKRHAEALAAWQRALDACEQADGKPMLVEDLQTVLRVRSLLHSNRGQALIDQEWWRRAAKELDEAVGSTRPTRRHCGGGTAATAI